jgi:hypothetical protein
VNIVYFYNMRTVEKRVKAKQRKARSNGARRRARAGNMALREKRVIVQEYAAEYRVTEVKTIARTIRASDPNAAAEKALDVAYEYREDGLGGAYGEELVGLTDPYGNNINIEG